MSRFIETIKLKDGEFPDLEYHQQRVNRTFSAFFPNTPPLQLKEILEDTCNPSSGTYRYTITYSRILEGFRIKRYQPRQISRLIIKEVEELDYQYKYADRSSLEILVDDLEKDEEIIIVKNGLVTDSSYANLAFFDGNSWWTPSTPLLYGTKRQKFLDDGSIREKLFKKEDIQNFRKCCLINAMLDLGEVEVETAAIVICNIRNLS